VDRLASVLPSRFCNPVVGGGTSAGVIRAEIGCNQKGLSRVKRNWRISFC
jgi:hypothetical protein